MCDSLHVPYKNLNPFNDKMSEVEYLRFMNKNWMAIERWADDLLKCCCGGGGSSILSASNGCGTATFVATQSMTITEADIITFGDPVVSNTFIVRVNGTEIVNVDLFGNSSEVIALSQIISSGDVVELVANGGITGSISIRVNVAGIDQTLTWSGCA